MDALQTVRRLGLQHWCIGAGAVRAMVWDALHGYPAPSSVPDVDVAYFDESDLSPQREQALQAQLSELRPLVPWELTNQARVHQWYAHAFGQATKPLRSLQEGIATWPEYATCVGVYLQDDGRLAVIAPHGLDDLFAMVIRHNPTLVHAASYRRRIAQKCYDQRWPQVTVIPA